MRHKILKREEGEQVLFLTVWPVYQEASMLNTFFFFLIKKDPYSFVSL